MITEKQLREQIRNTLLEFAKKSQEVLSEQDDTLSNADFIKGLKTGAADIASSVPTALNDDLAKVLQTLTAMAQYDKSKFQKMVDYADSLGAVAREKAQSGEKPEEQQGT